MVRLFGGVLIFIVSAYCGFYFSGRLKTHRDFLKAMSGALSFISAEIEFAHSELENILMRADTSTALCGFFSVCVPEIKKCGIRSAWTKAVDECADRASLKDEEKDVLIQLGGQIGMSDVEGHKKAISRAVRQLDEYAKIANEEYTRLSKPYRSCGILLGVFFLIMIA